MTHVVIRLYSIQLGRKRLYIEGHSQAAGGNAVPLAVAAKAAFKGALSQIPHRPARANALIAPARALSIESQVL